MKVLHIVSFYAPAYRYGGPIGSVHGLNKALVREGVEVTVYTTNTDGDGVLSLPPNEPVDRDGVSVYYFEASPLGRAWEYSRRMHRMLKAHAKEFDLIHITGVFRAASVLGSWYARKYGIPYVISPRGTLMEKPLSLHRARMKRAYLRFIEKRNLAHAAAIHFTVPAEKEEYLKAGLPLGKGIIVPNALDPDAFSAHIPDGRFRRSLGVSEDTPLALFLGRLIWKKGFDTLIPAWKEVRDRYPNAILAIVGGDDEGYRARIARMIGDAEIGDSVRFAGMLEGEDRVAAFRESDLFVLTSYSENFGMAPIEAAYFGMPVVVTEGVGVAPDIREAGAGFSVPKEVEAAAEAISSLFADAGLRKKMGECGTRLVRERFDTKAVARRFVEAYNELITHS